MTGAQLGRVWVAAALMRLPLHDLALTPTPPVPVDERLGLAEADRPRVGRGLGRALLLVRYRLTAMAYLKVIDKLVWVTIEAAGLIAEHPSGPIGVNAQPADVTGNPLERALEAVGHLIDVRHLAGDSGDEAYRS